MSEIYPGGDHQFSTNLGLALWGTDEVTTDNFLLIDSAFGGGFGTTHWSSLTNALANLALNNADFSTTFTQTSPVQWLWSNVAAPVPGVPQNSPIIALAGGSSNTHGTLTASDNFTRANEY